GGHQAEPGERAHGRRDAGVGAGAPRRLARPRRRSDRTTEGDPMSFLRPTSGKTRIRAAAVGLVAMLGTYASSGCGLESVNAYIPPADPGSIEHYESLEGVEITVGGKDFTEQLILGNMLAVIFDVAGA